MTTQQKLYIRLIKRPIGFLGALMALILLSPLFVATMVLLFFANKNGFKGIFFTQDRPGKNEKIFKVIKFKSMTDERDAEGKLLPDAQRLTKVGRFVRSTSIDELPQLINILKGDMALIGPRPLLVKYLPYYTEEESHRHDVRPGMTGWAQLHGRNSLRSWEQRFKYDIEYVNNVSFIMDLKIVFMTIKNIIKSEGVVEPGFMDDFDVYRIKQAANNEKK
ncbi:MAG: sugar transferase [Bacteroidales bacterium]|nr:sugar transferase [Bacteroidales bacterium]